MSHLAQRVGGWRGGGESDKKRFFWSAETRIFFFVFTRGPLAFPGRMILFLLQLSRTPPRWEGFAANWSGANLPDSRAPKKRKNVAHLASSTQQSILDLSRAAFWYCIRSVWMSRSHSLTLVNGPLRCILQICENFFKRKT